MLPQRYRRKIQIVIEQDEFLTKTKKTEERN